MGGGLIKDDQDLTLVLVGEMDNVKSSTGNSIIGSKSIESKRSSSEVTVTSEGKATQLEDDLMLDVIDTPGLFDSSAAQDLTLVLVGKTGNGKSATGNSILGSNNFDSKRSSSGVTVKFERKATQLENGRMLNVIDTPGINGSCVDNEFGDKCFNMARDGIQAFLVVVSIRSRFSKDEEDVISSLQAFFGRRIYDYMILVFTGGDQLDKDEETLEDFLLDCPEKLKEILNLCENRCVLFDNKTEDQAKRSDQVEKLFSFVNMVSSKNDGKLYDNELFTQWKKEAKELEEQAQSIWTELQSSLPTYLVPGDSFNQVLINHVEPKMKERTLGLERQLEAARAARLKAEDDAKATEEEIRKIKEQTENTRMWQRGLQKVAGVIISMTKIFFKTIKDLFMKNE